MYNEIRQTAPTYAIVLVLCMYVYIYIYVYMSISLSLSIYIYICIGIYVYMFIYMIKSDKQLPPMQSPGARELSKSGQKCYRLCWDLTMFSTNVAQHKYCISNENLNVTPLADGRGAII